MPSKTALKKVAKKAAKKAAKKVAKKAAKKSPGAHGAGQDTRRAYEHLHRLAVLHGQLEKETQAEVDALSRTAQDRLRAEDGRGAADLLRAAEHLAFGALTRSTADRSLSEPLEEAITTELGHLLFRAEQHPVEDEALHALYEALLNRAHSAYQAAAFHKALEFARGAEALTHVEPMPKRLSTQASPRRLR